MIEKPIAIVDLLRTQPESQVMFLKNPCGVLVCGYLSPELICEEPYLDETIFGRLFRGYKDSMNQRVDSDEVQRIARNWVELTTKGQS